MHVLLLAHGSRDRRHAAAMAAVVDALRASGTAADVAFLDLVEPDVLDVVLSLPSDVAQPVVAVPMLLTSAFHASVDVPAAVAAAVAARPDLDVRTAAVLGPDPLLAAAVRRRLDDAEQRPRGAEAAVLLVAAGSSDDAARAEVERVAQDVIGGDTAVGTHAFASGPGPGVGEAVETILGTAAPVGRVATIVLVPYFLADGVLLDRAATVAESAADAHGVRLVRSAAIGAAPELVELVLRRAHDAAAGPANPAPGPPTS